MSIKLIIFLYVLKSLIKCHYCQYDGESNTNLTLIFKWNTLDYKWFSKDQKSRFVEERKYIPENNFLTDFKIWKSSAYVTIPRWKPGIPVTLAKISIEPISLPASPDLEPYPSWSMQTLDDCFALQSAHNIDIDSEGKLWILDRGMVEELTINRSLCPPKLVIVDLKSNYIVRHAAIPFDMMWNSSIITTMALEKEKQIAFISDSNYNSSGFLVYNYSSALFKRYKCEQLNPDEDTAIINYVPDNITPEIVSVALNTDRNKLYFSAFDSSDLYHVNVSAFYNNNASDISAFVENIGKNGRSVKLISDSKGYMYFDILNKRAVAQWRETSWVFQYTPHIVIQTKLLFHWISALDVDEKGYLWIISGKFYDYTSNKVNVQKENFRIFKMHLSRKEKPKKPRTGFNAEYVVLILFIIIIGLIIIEILMFNID